MVPAVDSECTNQVQIIKIFEITFSVILQDFSQWETHINDAFKWKTVLTCDPICHGFVIIPHTFIWKVITQHCLLLIGSDQSSTIISWLFTAWGLLQQLNLTMTYLIINVNSVYETRKCLSDWMFSQLFCTYDPFCSNFYDHATIKHPLCCRYCEIHGNKLDNFVYLLCIRLALVVTGMVQYAALSCKQPNLFITQ